MEEKNSKIIDAAMVGEVMQIVQRLPSYAKLIWLLLKDPHLPRKQRAALMAAVGYSVSPVDAIPGIIPVVGQLDDLAVVLYTIRWVVQSIPHYRAEKYFSQTGLSAQILEDDLNMVKRHGIRILKRTSAFVKLTALTTWEMGKLAARGIAYKLRKCA